MAANFTRLLFFGDGALHAIINADFDGEIEPHKAPLGGIFVDVARPSYSACTNLRDTLALALPAVLQKDLQIGGLVSAKIQALDLAAQIIPSPPDVSGDDAVPVP